MDGGFVIKKLQTELRAFPSADQVETLAHGICAAATRTESEPLRVYFYHARPAANEVTNPISREVLSLAGTTIFRSHESLIDTLELKTSFAVRLGETTVNNWRIGSKAMESMLKKPREIEARDLVPDISQTRCRFADRPGYCSIGVA